MVHTRKTAVEDTNIWDTRNRLWRRCLSYRHQTVREFAKEKRLSALASDYEPVQLTGAFDNNGEQTITTVGYVAIVMHAKDVEGKMTTFCRRFHVTKGRRKCGLLAEILLHSDDWLCDTLRSKSASPSEEEDCDGNTHC